MDLLFLLLRYAAVFVALGILDTLLAAGAFRVNLGGAEFPMDAGEFWQRSALAGFALAAYTFAAAFVALVLYGRTAYWLFGILMVPYVVLAVYLYSWAYALEDLLEGFKIFLIHHGLPIILLIACIAFRLNVDNLVRFLLPA